MDGAQKHRSIKRTKAAESKAAVAQASSGPGMFRGHYEYNLNAQGRVSLPSKFRQVLDDGGFSKLIIVGLPDRLEIYPEEEYRKKEIADMNLPADDPRVMEYLVMQSYNVFEADLDGQGRILIPPSIRNELGLSREVVFVGLKSYILAFSPEQWNKFRAQATARHAENSLLVSKIKSGNPQQE